MLRNSGCATAGAVGRQPPGEWASALAIYHCSMKPIARASGRSAVASAAYRAGQCLTNERDGLTHDFTRRDGVEHSEIVLPEGVSAEWALDRSALWNAAELAEKRKDARVAREFEIALPHELSQDERLEAARAFARDLADRYGAAVDFAIHAPHQPSDVRNHHAHVMMTTRKVISEGLGRQDLYRAGEQMADRQRSARRPTFSSGTFARRGSRSPMSGWRGPGSMSGSTIGRTGSGGSRSSRPSIWASHATQMQRRGMEVGRTRLDAEAARRNAELIREKPEEVLSLITNEKSVFDRRDIARALHRHHQRRRSGVPERSRLGHGVSGAGCASAGTDGPGDGRGFGGALFHPRDGRGRGRHGACGGADARGAHAWRRPAACRGRDRASGRGSRQG